ncbi:MAG: prepilin-type N-terminal cleavage/methylation domain-containing protein [Clostridiales bacterium]|jgi:prepilin-type N-terminal cleavage/methylation domain-containing protein|nr:prepilin-type N-terminal cleavage/methylation domain-containing protein [Clostridiales bacterium]
MARKKQGGFSLVETIVAIAVLLIILAVAGSAFASMLRSMVASQTIYAMHEAENNLRVALLAIARDARVARLYDGMYFDGDDLIFYIEGIGTATYSLSAGRLERDADDGWPTNFVPVYLTLFEFVIDDPWGLKVTVAATAWDGQIWLPPQELEMSISMQRLVPHDD